MARVYKTDSYLKTAEIIFNEFEINQSCLVEGFTMIEEIENVEGDIVPKGEMVIKELERLDRTENFVNNGGLKGLRRRRKMLPNSIGDYVAHKIFRWDKRIVDNKPKYTIWRYQ